MKIALGLLALAGIAATSNAGITATWREIDSPELNAPGPSVYLGIAGPYAAFGAATGPAGFDSYVSTAGGTSFIMSQFVFVGGVAQAGGQVRFDFFDTSNALVNFFTVNLPTAGDFIWTITLGGDPDGLTSTFAAPSAGTVQMTVGAGFTGRWFLTTTGPTVGTNSFATGTGSTLNPQRNNAFEMRLAPTPGSLALLGLGGLAAARRRR